MCVCVGVPYGKISLLSERERERETLSYLIIGNSIPWCNESFDGNQSQRAAISLDPAERIRNLSLSLSLYPSHIHTSVYIYIYIQRESPITQVTSDARLKVKGDHINNTRENNIYKEKEKIFFFLFFTEAWMKRTTKRKAADDDLRDPGE